MLTSAPRRLAALFACLLFALPSLGEGVPKAQIAKAKAATALAVGKFRGAQGSAFCIHPGGTFLTNEHVIRELGTISLVLHPGSKKAAVVTARVLRIDKGLDLALLQVEGQKELPSLSLATDDKLAETDEVIAFGYPFGQRLSADAKEFPSISVNVGKVAALREKGGELHRIQFDAAVNPGNSGGPIMDKDAKGVGVVVSGVPGAGVNFAIPASRIARFLARPEILFEQPPLKVATVHEEVEFRARVLTFGPAGRPVDLELILKNEGKKPRQYAMKAKDGLYSVRAVPAPRAYASETPCQ